MVMEAVFTAPLTSFYTVIAHHLVHELGSAALPFDHNMSQPLVGGQVQVLGQLGRDSRLTHRPASISATNDASPLRNPP